MSFLPDLWIMPPNQLDTPTSKLWSFKKSDRTALAEWRPIEGYGCDIRFSVNGVFRRSQMFRTHDELMAESERDRKELLGLGWKEDR